MPDMPGTAPTRAPRLKTVSKRSPWGTLLSRTLPQYNGPHKHVGCCDIELPIPKQSFGDFIHTRLPDSEAGLQISSVLFTLFYPCQEPTSRQDPVAWFPNFGQTIDGFIQMAKRTPNFLYRAVAYPTAAAAIWGTTFPAVKNAPLLEPPEGKRYPLILFSHGVGCSRLMYSAWCGQMASRGYIVAAIEHRDGSGPSSAIVADDGTKKYLEWLQWSDLHWPELEKQPEDDTHLRKVQTQVRLAEMQATLEVMNNISKGATPYKIVETQDWSRWARYLSVHKPIMAGHSFGGTVAIAAADDPRFDFSRLLVSDPAVQRLEPWTGKIPLPLLSINSEEFVHSEDFQRLKRMAKTASEPPILLSVVGSTHPSYSDVFIIVPGFISRMTGLYADAEEVVEHFVNACEDVLDNHLEALRAETRPVPYDAVLTKPLGPTPGELLWHELEP